MKLHKVIASVVFLLLGCGNSNPFKKTETTTSDEEESKKDTGEPIITTERNFLPVCAVGSSSAVFFIKSEKKFFTCLDGDYKEIEIVSSAKQSSASQGAGPQGPTGPQGIPGPQGPSGINGKDFADPPQAKSAIANTQMLFLDALKYCYNLTESGFDDWRLPSVPDALYYAPILNADNYWTGEFRVDGGQRYSIRMSLGTTSVVFIETTSTSSSFSVFCVR